MNEQQNEEVRKRVKDYFRQLNVMFFVFLSGILLFLVSVLIVVYFQGAMNPQYSTFLLFGAPVSGAALMLIAHRLATGRIRESRKFKKLHEKMDGFRSGMVLRMVILDGAAFIQIIAYVMTANKLYLVLTLVVATVFMLYKPGLERFIKDMELNEMETRVMRDHGY